MSERSEKLAHYIRKARGKQSDGRNTDGAAEGVAGGANKDEMLDRGYALLKDDLAREFRNQIEEINGEPGCMDTLGSSFTDKESRIFKIGEEDHGLTIEFDDQERTAEIKGKEPIKFYYFIQARHAKDPSKWCYAGGETRNETKSITGQLDAVVDKVLFALFGVEA